MPEITETTPKTEITIAGKSFSVPQPYAAGHVLNANEAGALNQTYAENLRNNFAAKVKQHDEAGTFDQDILQGQLSDYANDYEFGVRTGGGRTGDPVMAEAMNIARDLVRKAIVKGGKHKLSDIKASAISKLAKDAIDSGKYPDIMETARTRVAAQQEIADIEIDSLDVSEGAGEAEEVPTPEAAPARRGRQAAEA